MKLLLLVWGPHFENHRLWKVNAESTEQFSGFEGKKKDDRGHRNSDHHSLDDPRDIDSRKEGFSDFRFE